MNRKSPYNGIPVSELREFLEEKYLQYNNPSFIPSDPVSIPHRFVTLHDREISGYLGTILFKIFTGLFYLMQY